MPANRYNGAMDPFFAFIAFAVLITLETLAAQSGLPAYFRFGLPIFIGRRPDPNRQPASQLAPLLSERLQVGLNQRILSAASKNDTHL